MFLWLNRINIFNRILYRLRLDVEPHIRRSWIQSIDILIQNLNIKTKIPRSCLSCKRVATRIWFLIHWRRPRALSKRRCASIIAIAWRRYSFQCRILVIRTISLRWWASSLPQGRGSVIFWIIHLRRRASSLPQWRRSVILFIHLWRWSSSLS